MTEELEVLRKALIDARALIGDVGGVRRKDTVAGVYDAVTDIDVAVERKVIGAIRSAFPEDAIIAEESSPGVCPRHPRSCIRPRRREPPDPP